MEKYRAVLFDMDGVIVDNHRFHEEAWIDFCKQYGIHLTAEDYKLRINGRTVTEVVQFVFSGRAQAITPAEVKQYSEEKEAAYRALYGPHLARTHGLLPFLDRLKAANIPMAVGTSAPTANVEFTLDGLGIRHYFQSIIDENGVTKGKPEPEIYLKSAAALGIPAEDCLVIEDALSGIKAGQNAGSGVLAMATTHTEEELRAVHPTGIAPDFTQLVFEDWFDA